LAVVNLGFHPNTARAIAVLRLFFWHLMQPVLYIWILYSYYDQLDWSQQLLGACVGVREALYVLLLLWGVCYRPAFLLVNLNAADKTSERW
jgi:hypothetical protein